MTETSWNRNFLFGWQRYEVIKHNVFFLHVLDIFVWRVIRGERKTRDHFSFQVSLPPSSSEINKKINIFCFWKLNKVVFQNSLIELEFEIKWNYRRSKKDPLSQYLRFTFDIEDNFTFQVFSNSTCFKVNKFATATLEIIFLA